MSLKTNKYQIVLRFQGLSPRQLSRFAMHGNRKGGDLDHIDHKLTEKNEILIGSQTWLDAFRSDLEATRAANLATEIQAKLDRQRPKEAELIRQRGAVDPWAPSKEGPMREGILTANADWFGGAGAAQWDLQKVERFKQKAVEFLKLHFGNSCIHARADWDEEALHIHFILAPWTEKTSSNRGTQKLLQPSSLPLLASYELAQEEAGKFFNQIGLERGQRHAAARREAKKKGLPLPPQIRHKPPTQWRRDAQAFLRAAAKALQEEQSALAQQQARLDEQRRALSQKSEALKQIRDRQIALQQQTDLRLNTMNEEIAQLAALWKDAGQSIPDALEVLQAKYPGRAGG